MPYWKSTHRGICKVQAIRAVSGCRLLRVKSEIRLKLFWAAGYVRVIHFGALCAGGVPGLRQMVPLPAPKTELIIVTVGLADVQDAEGAVILLHFAATHRKKPLIKMGITKEFSCCFIGGYDIGFHHLFTSDNFHREDLGGLWTSFVLECDFVLCSRFKSEW